MDKDKANKILDVYGRPGFKCGNTMVSFARQNNSSIAEIEKLNDEQLESEWKALSFINHIYGQVSLNELQRIDLLELEMSCRDSFKSKKDKLSNWFENELEKFEGNDENI